MLNGKFFHRPIGAPQTNYVVEDILNKDRMTIVASVPGEGKSLIFEDMLYCVAYGAPFLGKKVTPDNVMLVDSETPLGVLQSRLMRIRKGLQNDGYKELGKIDIQHYSGLLLDEVPISKVRSTWKEVQMAIQALQPSLIILDHLLCFHNQDENQAVPMRKVDLALRELAHTTNGASIVVLHHFGKNEGTFFRRLRGSSALYASSEVAYEVRTLERTNTNPQLLSKIGLIPQARKEPTMLPLRIKVEEGPGWLKLVDDGNYQPVDDPKLDLIEHRIYHTFLQDMDKKTVIQTFDILAGLGSIREVRFCLADLNERGLLSAYRGSSGSKWIYELPPGAAVCPWCYP